MRTLRVSAIALGGVLLLAGCASTGGPAAEAPTPSSTSAAPTPTVVPPSSPSTSPTPDPTDPPAEEPVTCETMLDPAVVAQYEAEGLAPLPKPFLTAHGVDVDGGISCPWGPADAPGQQATHVYSWGPLQVGQAAQVIEQLRAREPFEVTTGEGGTYLTATYSDGPGAVYFVTDRSIRFAETRDQLRHIVWVG